MTVKRDIVDMLADALDAAGREASPIEPPAKTMPGLSLDDAYAIQRAGRMLREARGERVVGRKIGLTSVAMQEMLGVEQPDFGYLTDAMVAPSAATFSAATLIAPRVETEVAFRLGADLTADADREAVLAATEAIAPAIEVIDSRVADWRIGIVDTVADNASAARVVIGSFVAYTGQDLVAMEASSVVYRGSGATERVSGRGGAVLGHPAEAVAWLAAALDRYGEQPRAGDIILPGAAAAALTVSAGDRAQATVPGLGTATVRFTAT